MTTATVVRHGVPITRLVTYVEGQDSLSSVLLVCALLSFRDKTHRVYHVAVCDWAIIQDQ